MHGTRPLDGVEQIDSAWLTEIIRHAGDLDADGQVETFTLESLTGTTRGYMSGIARLNMSYAGSSERAPTSLIVKLPPPGEERYEIGASLNLFEREMRFYRDISTHAVVRVPKCYYAGKSDAPRSTMIVMEDARTWRTPDQVVGLSQGTVEGLLDEIAGMHARWWLSPRLQRFDWLPSMPWDFTELYKQTWPGFIASFGEIMTSDQVSLGEAVAETGPALLEAFQQPPWTLVHSDIRADNLLVEGSGDQDTVMVLDWQTVSRSKGALDTARLVAGSLARPLAEADFRLFVQRWQERLLDLGVADYSGEEAWRDFQVGIVNAVYIPVCLHGNLANEGKRGRDLMETLVRRIFHAALACDALRGLQAR